MDCLNAAVPKEDTITFTRMYRHRVKAQNSNQVDCEPYTNTKAPRVVLPIQNAWTAAIKPTDLVGLSNLSNKFAITSCSVECSNFNAQELDATTAQVATATIPNLFLECYVDIDRDLPGYEQDFLARYATNFSYTTGDASEGDGDFDLRNWQWMNTTTQVFNPQTNLNLYNGRGMKFIKQTDDFRFVWDISSPQWRHTQMPWQYQHNPSLPPGTNDDAAAPNFTTAGIFLPNMVWGGFPDGRNAVDGNFAGNTATAQNSNDGNKTSETYNCTDLMNPQSNTGDIEPDQHIQGGGYSYGGRSFPYGCAFRDDLGTYYRRFNIHEGTARNQITGLAMENDPPPLILFRPNMRSMSKIVEWEFFCKYTVTVKYTRNQFRFDPVNMGVGVPTVNWTGSGNRHMVSLPGAAYNTRRDPISRITPFLAPPTARIEAAGAVPFLYSQNRMAPPVADRTRSKTKNQKETIDMEE
jgi:hypothetical protein